MSMSIIAILVSLAMMLTGAGTAGMPAASRTLRVSDIAIDLGGQEIAFDSTLRLGAYTDGQEALFDIAVEKDGEALFPIQISANDDRVAVAAVGQAIGVPTAVLNALVEQAQSQIQADPQGQQIIEFLTQEMLPAYKGVIEAANDPERSAQIKEKAKAALYRIIDRGEPVPDSLVLGDGNTYDVMRYNYTIDAQKMFQLADAVYTCDEALENYYKAMMKMYSMMPEESGLNDITSFADFGKKMNLDMKMEITETVSEPDDLDMMDAVLTVNLPPQAVQAAEGEDAQAVELPPMVFNIAAYEMGENAYSQVDFAYDFDGNGIVFNMTVEKDETGMSTNMDMQASGTDADGNAVTMAAFNLEAGESKNEQGDTEFSTSFTADGGEQGKFTFGVEGTKSAAGNTEYDAGLTVTAPQGEFTFDVEGSCKADGTGEAAVELGLDADQNRLGLRFNLKVSGEAIANNVNSADLTLIEDLSEAGLQALQEDQTIQGKIMQVTGRFMLDAQKLMADPGVETMLKLFAPAGSAVETTEEVEEVPAN